MSLRQDCISALYPFMDGDYDSDQWAEDALDALLEVLETEATGEAAAFVAALRER